MGEAVGGYGCYMPEEIEFKDPLQSGKAGQSGVGKGSINQQMCSIGNRLFRAGGSVSAVPLLQHREIMQEWQAGIGDQLAATEVAQFGFALQCLDGAIAGGRSHQVYALELITKSQVGNAGIGDAALPCQLECLKIGKMLQNFEPTICQTTTGVLVQIQMLQLWHAR